MLDTTVRTTAEIRAEIEEHQQRIAELRGQLAENALAITAAEVKRNEKIADGKDAAALNREITNLRIQSEGLAGGIAQLERRIVERETDLQEADLRERQADCDAAVERGVRSIEAMHALVITFITETFAPLDDQLVEACETARQAENRLSAATGQRASVGRVYEEGWRHHPGLDTVMMALRSFTPPAAHNMAVVDAPTPPAGGQVYEG